MSKESMQKEALSKVDKGVMVLPLYTHESDVFQSNIEINQKFLRLLTLKSEEDYSEEDGLKITWNEVFSYINENYKEKTFQKDLKSKFGVFNLTFIITDLTIWNGLLNNIQIKVDELQALELEKSIAKSVAKSEKKSKPSFSDSVLFVSLPEEEPVIDLTNSLETLEEEYYLMVGHFDDDIHLISQEGSKSDVMNFLLGFRDGSTKIDKMNESKYYVRGYNKGFHAMMDSNFDNGDDDFDWVSTTDNHDLSSSVDVSKLEQIYSRTSL